MKYQFEKSVAEHVGVEAAILLSNIEFWVEKNAANEKHFYDGNYWTYNSKKAFADLFPFWTERQIRRLLDKLVDSGMLAKGNYNKRSYDKTLWYTSRRKEFLMAINIIGPNGPIDLTKRSNRSDQMVEPIPDNKPDNKHVNVTEPLKNKNGPENGSGKGKGRGKESWLKQLPNIEITDEDKQQVVDALVARLKDPGARDYFTLAASKLPGGRLGYLSSVVMQRRNVNNPAAAFTAEVETYAHEQAEQATQRPLTPPEMQTDVQALAKTMSADP